MSIARVVRRGCEKLGVCPEDPDDAVPWKAAADIPASSGSERNGPSDGSPGRRHSQSRCGRTPTNTGGSMAATSLAAIFFAANDRSIDIFHEPRHCGDVNWVNRRNRGGDRLERCAAHSGGQNVLQSDSARAGDRRETASASTCRYVPVGSAVHSVSCMMTFQRPSRQTIRCRGGRPRWIASMRSRVGPAALGSVDPNVLGTVLAATAQVAPGTFG